MIRKLLIATLAFSLFQHSASSQHGVSFYTMGNATFQHTSYNPALLPQGKFFFGLPGINALVSSPVSFNELVGLNEQGQRQYNIDKVVDESTVNSFLGAHLNVHLFHIGFRTKNAGAFTLFANARSESDITLPQEAVQWFWKGNGTQVGRPVDFSRLGISSNTFYEVGIGYANQLLDGRLTYGGRLKYYQGILNMSTPASFSAKILTEAQNFQLNAEIENGIIRTAGLETVRGEGGDLATFALSNGNRGAGLDFGFDYRISNWYSVQLAVSDLGFINWQDDIRNHLIQSDTALRYTGVQLKGLVDLKDAVNDTLVEKFERSEFTESYLSPMVARVMGSFTWFTPYFGMDVVSTIGTRIVQAQPKMIYGVGVRKRFGPKLILSATANKLPQQFFNVGAAVSATAGVLQFYAAADRVIGFSAPNMRWAEFRVGLNIVIGSGRKKTDDPGPSNYDNVYTGFPVGKISEQKGVTTGSFMGKRVDAKRTEGIYTIIPKQEKNPAGTITPELEREGKRRGRPASASGRDQRLFDKSRPQAQSATGKSQLGFFEKIFGEKKKRPASVSGQQNRKGFFERLFGGKKKQSVTSPKPKFKKKKRRKRN